MLSHEKRGTNSDSDHVVMVINLRAMSNKIYPLLVVGWGEGRGGGGGRPGRAYCEHEGL